jgi:hypothetical protein
VNLRRVAPYAVPVVLLAGLLTSQSAAAGARPTVHSVSSTAIGELAYLTKGQQVRIATVSATGAISNLLIVGPVTKPAAKDKVQISNLMSSGDGAWLAWEENVVKPAKHGTLFLRSVLVLRNQDGVIDHLKTEQAPIGFTGDTLVTTDTATTDWVDTQPTIHLVKIENNPFSLTAAPQGVVDTAVLKAPPGPDITIRLRLTTFSRAHTVLHDYVLGSHTTNLPDAGWVSGDGKHLVIERGDHTDFGGVGNSSQADEFSLSGGISRHPLGHFGTAKAQWRLGSVSFQGSADTVWGEWYRLGHGGVKSVIANYNGGKWHQAVDQGIAVAANHNGYVVAQSGKWVSIGTDIPDYKTVPVGDPVLLHAGSPTAVIKTPGTEFAWLAGPEF